MPIPSQSCFEDDFLGVHLNPCWNTAGNIILMNAGGLAQLWSTSASNPARLRLGEDLLQVSGLPNGVQNWQAGQCATLEARIVLNTTDCQATVGFVGAGDGYIPNYDFAALWRPGGWSLQSSNVGGGGGYANQLTSLSHTPGTWVDFCLSFCNDASGATIGTFSANGQTLATVTDQNVIPSAPMFVEFQIWGTPTNSNACMWVDWVGVSQDRA